MSTVTSCTLFSGGPAVRLANSCAGRLPSVAPAAIAPFSSRRRSRPLSVCCANTQKGEHNPKTDLHPFNISPVVLVHPVPPRDERWKLKEEPGRVDLWFEVPGHSKEDLAVEIDEDVLVIKKRAKTPPVPEAQEAAADDDAIYARLLLPAGYSKEGVKAVLKSGVLEVNIAKVKEQARRKINVNIEVRP